MSGSTDASKPTLADTGFEPESDAAIGDDHARRLAACLDIDTRILDAGELPMLWHWACFLPLVTAAELGPDGHSRRRPEMDAFPQRMWVGGRVRGERALQLGLNAERISRLARAEPKEGSTGRFWLLTVAHTISQAGAVCVEEEQDLVLRKASAVAMPGDDRDDPPGDEWVEERHADPVLLFRFSASTANAHRIHYDHPYATNVEGYPDLVVHGPLTALLLADFARRHHGEAIHEIAFRAHMPHFANRRFWLAGHPTDDGIETAAVRADHAVAMTLTAR
ncbi:MAG TPA: acyl-CoA dehydrogenase [Acidimicrobiia bacterium]